MSLDIKNLCIRTVSGLAYAGLLIGAIVLGGLATAILCSVFAAVAAYEMGNNTVRKNNPESWTITTFLDAAALVLLILGTYFVSRGMDLCMALFIVMVFARIFVQIFINQEKALQSVSLFPFEILYIGVPFALLVTAVRMVCNPWIVVCCLAMIWISDTGAYLVGSMFGRHKLSPRLSPKKSWEGLLGGLLFNIGAAFIFFYCFHLDDYNFISNVQGWIFIGICVTAFATLGDLFESLLKRSIGIKDFGTAIPGHGGVLDRVDSLLFVVPCLIAAVIISINMFGV